MLKTWYYFLALKLAHWCSNLVSSNFFRGIPGRIQKILQRANNPKFQYFLTPELHNFTTLFASILILLSLNLQWTPPEGVGFAPARRTRTRLKISVKKFQQQIKRKWPFLISLHLYFHYPKDSDSNTTCIILLFPHITMKICSITVM